MTKILKVTILLIGVSLFASGCSKGGGSGDSAASAASDSLVGTYFMSGTMAGTNDYLNITAEIEPDNKITYYEAFARHSSPSTFYYRKKVGTFTKTNNIIIISWIYETCNPVLTQAITVNTTNPADRIFVTMGPTTFQMLNVEMWVPSIEYANTFFTMTEDVHCLQIPD